MKKQTPSPKYFSDRLNSALAFKTGLSMSIAALILSVSAGQTFGAVAPKLLSPQFIDGSDISNLHMVGGMKKGKKGKNKKRKARKFPDSKVLKNVPKRGAPRSRSNAPSRQEQRIFDMFDEMDQAIQDAAEQVLRQNRANRNGRRANSKPNPRGEEKGVGGNSRNTNRRNSNRGTSNSEGKPISRRNEEQAEKSTGSSKSSSTAKPVSRRNEEQAEKSMETGRSSPESHNKPTFRGHQQ